MATIILPVVLALIGGAVYVLSARPTIQELGRLLFAAGAFATAFLLSGYKFSV